jgi:orotidine-5'-phosphate decarboxylase
MNSAKDKLIVALDVESAEAGLELFDELREVVGMFKIGSQLFTAAGPDLVRRIVGAGARVFLDLKFHDIPNTVAAAAVAATRLGVSIFNLHASGGTEMMKRTRAAVDEVAAREGVPAPKVIAVTILTSLDQSQLDQVGIAGDPKSAVKRLAALTAQAGLDGVVASPEEIAAVRETVLKPDFLVVTPGIRQAKVDGDDQRRVLTITDAIRAGASHMVVGRPILQASDRRAAAQRMVEEIAAAELNALSTSQGRS